ncbi:hypothetical protein I4U23_017475 [Adineta vaga]|nr:hypothetical protein I4U23_017475 [Adineta vaga]
MSRGDSSPVAPFLGFKLKLSQASQDIIRKASGRQGKVCAVMTMEIAQKQKEFIFLSLPQKVPLLIDEEDVIDVDEVALLRGKASYVLPNVETDTNLFETVLCSHPSRPRVTLTIDCIHKTVGK